MSTGLSITASASHNSAKATAWSITWYPEHSMEQDIAREEIEEFAKKLMPPGWKLTGQMEQCPNTKRFHYQALLRTPQVRFSAVKKLMPKAHVEPARNRQALALYVQKKDTQVASISSAAPIPTIWEYQTIISSQWKKERYNELWLEECAQADLRQAPTPCPNETALLYLDELVAADIESGRRGAEFIAINPMWRSSWKRFWRSIIKRDGEAQQASPSTPPDEAPSAPPHNAE